MKKMNKYVPKVDITEGVNSRWLNSILKMDLALLHSVKLCPCTFTVCPECLKFVKQTNKQILNLKIFVPRKERWAN